MTYFCEDCGFVFCRTGDIRECPYCGEKRIRTAAEAEGEQLDYPGTETGDESGIY
ncbi:MAG: hypothetical protein PHC91_08735 [Eubacteriales bacterium]|nr:hypothetical protein [Eubacteriales bacterium]